MGNTTSQKYGLIRALSPINWKNVGIDNGNVFDASAASFVVPSFVYHPTISAPAAPLQDIFQHRGPFVTKNFWHNVFSAIQQRTEDKGVPFAEEGKAKIPSFRRKQKFQLFCKFAF